MPDGLLQLLERTGLGDRREDRSQDVIGGLCRRGGLLGGIHRGRRDLLGLNNVAFPIRRHVVGKCILPTPPSLPLVVAGSLPLAGRDREGEALARLAGSPPPCGEGQGGTRSVSRFPPPCGEGQGGGGT